MVVIFIAIHPVDLQPLRGFGSEADFVPLQRGGTTSRILFEVFDEYLAPRFV